MKYETLPKMLYDFPGVKKVLYHNDSCILYKKLSQSLLAQEKISTSHCIVFVVKGKVEVKTVEGECVSACKNEMLFMPRDTYLISDLIKKQKTLEVFLVFFDHEIVVKFLGLKFKEYKKPLTNSLTISRLEANNKVMDYFKSLKEIYFDLENNKDILELKILEFLHLACLNNQSKIIDTLNSSENQKKRRNIESIMIANYDKSLTISDYANLSGRSLSTFNRDFKRKYNQTPKQWLIERKMEKAVKLLLNGINVTNTAVEVGYSNVSHFIKAYKLIYSKTPKSLTKNIL